MLRNRILDDHARLDTAAQAAATSATQGDKELTKKETKQAMMQDHFEKAVRFVADSVEKQQESTSNAACKLASLLVSRALPSLLMPPRLDGTDAHA